MNKTEFSTVEQAFIAESGITQTSARIPYIVVEHFPKLGLLTALRFLEWAIENPEGVISLPTGKTPEYFIKWTQFLLENWNRKKGLDIRTKYGLKVRRTPDLRGLQFVQIDEFYPINPEQHNSCTNYVLNFYINGFNLDINKALLMNSEDIPLADGRHYLEVFPGNIVDLSLRYRECKTSLEKLQQKSIFMIDKWCMDYETRIRDKGGIGFFLGELALTGMSG
jgi:glucosamine-6-phosphate deaminase